MRILQKPYSLSLMVLAMLYVTGCPGQVVKPTPQAAAAKTLLTARQAVIGTATTLSELCKRSIIKQSVCMQVEKDYLLAQVAYKAASDLEQAAFAVGAPADTLQRYQQYGTQLIVLLNDLQMINNQIGGIQHE